jgi:antitoxin (DNA-binding transcriptional repressor) of toxin-antitoxin stability system
MTATLEQVQSEWRKLIKLAQSGEEVVITSEGRAIAKLTGIGQSGKASKADYENWLKELANLRESLATGKTSPTTDEILDDLRSDRD